MIVNIRPRSLRRRLTLVGLGGLLAAAVVTMPTARADVADYTARHGAQICSDIDAQPTDKGVDQVALKMFADNLTPEQASSVLYSSMTVFCPWDEAVMRHWASGVTGSLVVA